MYKHSLSAKSFKALSVRQPWVSMIFDYGKDFENRKWRSRHWGPLLIHSAKLWDLDGYRWLTKKMRMDIPEGPTRHRDRRGGDPYIDMPGYEFRSLSGFVTAEGWISKSPSKWFDGPFGIVIKDPVRFEVPIEWKRGWPSFFSINAQELYDMAVTMADRYLIEDMSDLIQIG